LGTIVVVLDYAKQLKNRNDFGSEALRDEKRIFSISRNFISIRSPE
jgi:hypothetical protein